MPFSSMDRIEFLLDGHWIPGTVYYVYEDDEILVLSDALELYYRAPDQMRYPTEAKQDAA